MHKQSFYFISKFEKKNINNLDKDIHIIYRNYTKKYDIDEILEVKKICKLRKRKLFLANNLKLAIKLNLDGVYIPSFNKNIIPIRFNKKKFCIIGSAHNLKEISEKRRQGVEFLFISPLFKIDKRNYFLGPVKYNILAGHFKNKTIALGGINKRNINIINKINCYGFASISYIEKNKIK
tara:strand:- start:270 stop:806 length:537 start_codon:yes stop_codon:yes gene_type:complete